MDVDEEIDVVTTAEEKTADTVASDNEEDEDKEYEVEKILKQKRERGRTLFLVRWRGYSPSNDSWEPKENLVDGAQDVLDAFLEEQAQSKKKGVKRSAGETSKTPKRVKSTTPESDGKDEEMSGDDDDEFKVESSKKKGKSTRKSKGGGRATTSSARKRPETPSRAQNKLSSSDSRIAVNRSLSSLQTAVEARVKNNVFQSWLDSDEDDDDRGSISEGKNVKTDINDNKIKEENGELELKLNTTPDDEDKNKINGKIVENGGDVVRKNSNGKANNDNKTSIDSPPPPTDPEENGEDNSKAKDLVNTPATRLRSTTIEKNDNKNSFNNISAKDVPNQNGKQKKSKNEGEVSADVENEKDKEKPSSEFRIDVMFRDNVGKLKLVANLGMLSECQITDRKSVV